MRQVNPTTNIAVQLLELFHKCITKEWTGGIEGWREGSLKPKAHTVSVGTYHQFWKINYLNLLVNLLKISDLHAATILSAQSLYSKHLIYSNNMRDDDRYVIKPDIHAKGGDLMGESKERPKDESSIEQDGSTYESRIASEELAEVEKLIATVFGHDRGPVIGSVEFASYMNLIMKWSIYHFKCSLMFPLLRCSKHLTGL